MQKDFQRQFIDWAEKYKGAGGYSIAICECMNLVDNRVHDDDHCCEWVAPYGFVIQAGCKKHD